MASRSNTPLGTITFLALIVAGLFFIAFQSLRVSFIAGAVTFFIGILAIVFGKEPQPTESRPRGRRKPSTKRPQRLPSGEYETREEWVKEYDRLWRARGSPFSHVPFMDRTSTAPFDTDFRFRKDPDHFIRIKQKYPQGYVQAYGEVKVAGVSLRQSELGGFINGRKRRVRLEREPDNPKDPNAIKVIGSWTEKIIDEQREAHLGYIPKTLAARIAREYPGYPIEATIHLMKPAFEDMSAGLEIYVHPPGKVLKRKLDAEKAPGQ